MRLFNIIVFIFILSGCSTPIINEKEETISGPACIGEFCFNVESISMLMKEKDFVNKYGEGYSKEGKFAYYCFKVMEPHLFLRFRPYHGENREIMDIFVSEAEICSDSKPPKKPFQNFATHEGLKLGDSYEKVISIYGLPVKIEAATAIELVSDGIHNINSNKPLGEKVLKYWSKTSPFYRSEIFVKKGRVSAILISAFP